MAQRHKGTTAQRRRGVTPARLNDSVVRAGVTGPPQIIISIFCFVSVIIYFCI